MSPATATPTDITAIAATYFAAWERRDPDAIVALHSDDTTFWIHSGGRPVEGREAVRAAFADLFERFPELGFEEYRTFYGADHWVLDWALTATVNGRPVRFDCVDVVAVDADGKVTRKDTFVDAAQMQAALGAAS